MMCRLYFIWHYWRITCNALDEKDSINFQENLTGKTKLDVGIGGNDTKKTYKEIEQIDFAGIN